MFAVDIRDDDPHGRFPLRHRPLSDKIVSLLFDLSYLGAEVFAPWLAVTAPPCVAYPV